MNSYGRFLRYFERNSLVMCWSEKCFGPKLYRKIEQTFYVESTFLLASLTLSVQYIGITCLSEYQQ
jgi:hypothetical protein